MLEQFRPGTVIPKPAAKSDFLVKGMGRRRGERALVYQIPNHKNPNRPYEKGITVTEFARAREVLLSSGEFNHEWFKQNMSECASEGTCNFTSIGGLLELQGIAYYERGRYIRTREA